MNYRRSGRNQGISQSPPQPLDNIFSMRFSNFTNMYTLQLYNDTILGFTIWESTKWPTLKPRGSYDRLPIIV